MSRLRDYVIKVGAGEVAELAINASVIRLSKSNVDVRFFDAIGLIDFKLKAGEVATLKSDTFKRISISHKSLLDEELTLTFADDADILSSTLSGSVTVLSGLISIAAPSLASIEYYINNGALKTVNDAKTYTGSIKHNVPQASGVVTMYVAPASNVNGMIINRLEFACRSAVSDVIASCFLAKSSAPATSYDGDCLLSATSLTIDSSIVWACGSTDSPIKVAAGKGLYFYSAALEQVTNRGGLYTLL